MVEPGQWGAVDRTRDRVFDELVGRRQGVHRRYGQLRSARAIRLNYSGGSSVFICRGLGLYGAKGVRQVRTCHRSLQQPIHSVGPVSATAR
jgi:hypothetical protein